MMQEIGFCQGIENYSRHISGRAPGSAPYTLLDYFPDDYLMIIDESHVTIPQVRAMYNGDRARKETLIKYGFRLPSAADNRPLKFEEFEDRLNQVIFTSATPSDYEKEHSKEHNVSGSEYLGHDKFNGYYYSYDGATYEEFKVVTPQQVVVIEYNDKYKY